MTGYLVRSGSNGAGELLSHSAQATIEGPLTAPHLTDTPLEWAAQEEGESKKTEEEASGMVLEQESVSQSWERGLEREFLCPDVLLGYRVALDAHTTWGVLSVCSANKEKKPPATVHPSVFYTTY
ncbi:hypothetical protein B296_00031718 [Ensete ventricosum]|uniref:Uncharacterized protein n=1 Tax=Ensete ventricosum TaxID=4639 RepID=A0A426XTJ6_ENSVE|nr:hypothetical protein B296_00031718 [Ensete ventricosum]